jgi:hypothetical protein
MPDVVNEARVTSGLRPEQTGGNCDIGAVEVQLPLLPAAAPPAVIVTPRFTG